MGWGTIFLPILLALPQYIVCHFYADICDITLTRKSVWFKSMEKL